MAGAVDLFAGSSSVHGANLFQVDKSPLDQLDGGIQDVVGQQATGAGSGIVSGIEALLRSILGLGQADGLLGVGSDFLGTIFNLDTFFGNLELFLGEINPLDPHFDPLAAAATFINTILGPTGLLAFLDPLTGLLDPILLPFIDASKIITGTLNAVVLQPLLDLLSVGLGAAAGLGFPELGEVVNDLFAFIGGPTGLGTGSPLAGALEGIPLLGPLLTPFVDFVQQIAGAGVPAGDGGGLTGFFSIFTDLFGLLGNPTGMGSGNPIVSLIDDIPIFGPLIGGLIDSFIGSGSGLFGLGGITSIFTDLFGLLGNPTGVGSGSPILGLVGDIPIFGPFISGLINSFVGTGSGLFGLGGITSIFSDLFGILGNPTGVGSGDPILGLVNDIPIFGPLISGLIDSFIGGGSGLSGLGGIGSIFGDLFGLLGNPTGIGSGDPILGLVSDIPIFGPLISGLISSFVGGGSGLSGLGGIGSIFSDLFGILGSPTGVGSGDPILGLVSDIPIFGPLFSGLISTLVGGGSGLSGLGGLGGIFTDLFGLLGNPSGLGSGNPVLGLVDDIPIFGPLFSGVIGAILGPSSGLPSTNEGMSGIFSDIVNLIGSPAGLGTGSPIVSLADSVPIFGPLFGGLISILAGSGSGIDPTTHGLGGIFLDVFGLLGNPTGLGSGSPSIGAAGSIPILGPLIQMFLDFVTTLTGGIFGGDPLGGFFNIFGDVLGILGNPTGLGTGSPVLGLVGDIPFFGPLISGLISSFVGGGSGLSGLGGIGSIFSDLFGILGNPTGVGSGSVGILDNIPLLGPLIDGLLGGSGNPVSSLINAFTGLVGGFLDLGNGTHTLLGNSGATDLGNGSYSIGSILSGNPIGSLINVGSGIVTSIAGAVQNIADLFGVNNNLVNSLQNTVDTIVNTFLSPIDALFGHPVSSISQVLSNIPPNNVGGLNGAAGLGTSVQDVTNAVANGLSYVPGLTGSGGGSGGAGAGGSPGYGSAGVPGATPANVATAAAGLATTQAQMQALQTQLAANAAAAIVSYPTAVAIDPTADAVFHISQMSGITFPSVSLTQATSVGGYIGTPNAGIKKTLIWLGQGTTSVTGIYVTIYKVNVLTGALTQVHHSPNILSFVSNTLSWNYYTIPDMAVEQGDWYAAEMQITGSGTYQVSGLPSHWLPPHPSVYPASMGWQRSTAGVTTAPSTIASPLFSANVPWFAMGGAAHVTPRQPELTYYLSNVYVRGQSQQGNPNVYPIPSWMVDGDSIDLAILGGGCAGTRGYTPIDQTYNGYGSGGLPGQWMTRTLIMGTHITSGTTSLTAWVGEGGTPDFTGAPAALGGSGGTSYVEGPGFTRISALGGIPQSAYANPGGIGPFVQTFNGQDYYGGTDANIAADGSAPGGGGGGGYPTGSAAYGYQEQGGYGQFGAVYIMARQAE